MAERRDRSRRRWLIGVALGVLALGAFGYVIYGGGRHQEPGVVHGKPLPTALRAARARLQPAADKQILFGDLHVHTTFSADAFMRSLPVVGGEGAHPPADACDFARFCSGLDFFSIDDHAESLTPERWRETKESVRQCNAVAGDPTDPDLVAFIGWEWSQVGVTPEQHYGHKNVIFRDTEDSKLPTRPIGAPGLTRALRSLRATGGQWWSVMAVPILDFAERDRYMDAVVYQQETASVRECPAGVGVRELPDTCRENAATPRALFDKLAEWGFEALVIPHGTTWGFYTPPGYRYDKQIAAAQDAPQLQRLVEIYSGHGNSEEYRSWQASELGPDGQLVCPEPTSSYEACCWRAGEIIRARCAGLPAEECERRVTAARKNYLAAGVAGHLTVPGASVADWKDCGQCRDCYNPAFNFRPGGSVQYLLARSDFSGPSPRNLQLGFIASSDNHSARPGTGYKEYARRKLTEATGPVTERWRDMFFGARVEPRAESDPLPRDATETIPPYRLVHLERQSSFFMTGGLVAVHSSGRSREQIWEALQRREVYGTSGERILLWFDVLEGERRHPMGSALTLGATPRFHVKALGAFEQKPGCPDFGDAGPDQRRLERLCLGECYHPGDRRRAITRIEVVRIRPQRGRDEEVGELVDDVWKTLECHDTGAGCEASFEDEEFGAGARDALYYVRAIQEPTPAVNAGGVRCKRDSAGRCLEARPCYGDYRTPLDDDCLEDNEERAWSSPIYVKFVAPGASDGGESPPGDRPEGAHPAPGASAPGRGAP